MYVHLSIAPLTATGLLALGLLMTLAESRLLLLLKYLDLVDILSWVVDGDRVLQGDFKVFCNLVDRCRLVGEG